MNTRVELQFIIQDGCMYFKDGMTHIFCCINNDKIMLQSEQVTLQVLHF